MEWIPRLLALVSTTLALVAFRGGEAASPAPAPSTSAPIASQAMPEPTVTPTTTANDAVIPPTARCGGWWGSAVEAGWEPEDLETLDYVMWRESRCDPSQHNTTLNRDGSTDIGLTQVNDRSWCLPTRWYPNGYLQTVGVLRNVGCEELFDPIINLKAAKAIYDYSKEANGNGWQPWQL